MKWSRLGLETAPRTETQADPQEGGLPQRSLGSRWLPLLPCKRIYLDLRGRGEAERGGWSRGWRVKREWGRGEWARADIWIRQEAIGVCMTKRVRHLPWLVSQCGTKAMQPPHPTPPGGWMCGAHTCLCIQGVISGWDSGGRRQVSGSEICAHTLKGRSLHCSEH